MMGANQPWLDDGFNEFGPMINPNMANIPARTDFRSFGFPKPAARPQEANGTWNKPTESVQQPNGSWATSGPMQDAPYLSPSFNNTPKPAARPQEANGTWNTPVESFQQPNGSWATSAPMKEAPSFNNAPKPAARPQEANGAWNKPADSVQQPNGSWATSGPMQDAPYLSPSFNNTPKPAARPQEAAVPPTGKQSIPPNKIQDKDTFANELGVTSKSRNDDIEAAYDSYLRKNNIPSGSDEADRLYGYMLNMQSADRM